MSRRVVVTGLGVVSPLGCEVEEMWQNLIDGKSGIDYVKSMNVDDFDVKIGAEVRGLDKTKYLDKKEVKRIDDFIVYGVNSALDAIADSGINIEEYGAERVGVIYASGMGGLKTLEDNYSKYVSKGPSRISPFFIPYTIIDMAAGVISIKSGAKGPNFGVVSACASGGHAIATAYMSIKQGICDVVVTGGSEAAISVLGLGGFISSKALCNEFETPQQASRPFDKTRAGFVMGEGGGGLILEDLESAQKRGAKIYGEIVGIGMTGDAYHITSPSPNGEGGARAIKMAIKDVDVDEIGYINAHGTSTKLNDKFETAAIKSALGEDVAKKINISSTKSMTGHMLGAAGAVEAIISLLSLRDGIIPPTINYSEPDPECDLNYTPNKAVKKEYEVALSNSLGFGGHNVTLAIKRFKA